MIRSLSSAWFVPRRPVDTTDCLLQFGGVEYRVVGNTRLICFRRRVVKKERILVCFFGAASPGSVDIE